MEKENPFKKIALPSKEIPTVLKQKVMNDVAKAKLTLDIDGLNTNTFKNVQDNPSLTNKKKED